MSLTERVLWITNLVLVLVFLMRLVQTGLYRRYRWFFLLLVCQAGQTFALLPFKPTSNSYAWVYLASQPLMWVAYILAVLELFNLALSSYPGLASMSRWVLTGGMLAAVAAAAMTLPADLSGPAGEYPVLVAVGVIERGLTFSLVLFLLVVMVFLLWTPVQVSRNLVVHATLFCAYFSATAAGLFVRNVLGYALVGVVSSVLLSINNLCLLLWIVFLNRKGEETPVVIRRLWRQDDEDQITRQLDAINAFLLRSAGKQDR